MQCISIKFSERNECVGWDEFFGFMVVTSSEKQARKIANKCDYGFTNNQDLWPDVSRVDCQLTGNACRNQEAEVILNDFRAG